MKDKSHIVQSYIDDYQKSSDRLQKFVLIIVEKLERALRAENIMARVSGRVKTVNSLTKKLEKWSSNPQKKKRIKKSSDVFSVIGDLAAVRVMTYVEADRERVLDIAKSIFTHRAEKTDFEFEKKEESKRIKDNPFNYYRASHLQICLKAEELTGSNENLKDAHCELQITSMLAHVWNEIEHDIGYKVGEGGPSEEEKLELESLGLLTKTGDNIIVNLIEANKKRLESVKTEEQKKNEMLQVESLPEALQTFYGHKLFGRQANFLENADSLYSLLEALNFLHPSNLYNALYPADIEKAIEKDFPEFVEYCDRTTAEHNIKLDDVSCDVFIIALLVKYYHLVPKYSKKGPKPRWEMIRLQWCDFKG